MFWLDVGVGERIGQIHEAKYILLAKMRDLYGENKVGWRKEREKFVGKAAGTGEWRVLVGGACPRQKGSIADTSRVWQWGTRPNSVYLPRVLIGHTTNN